MMPKFINEIEVVKRYLLCPFLWGLRHSWDGENWKKKVSLSTGTGQYHMSLAICFFGDGAGHLIRILENGFWVVSFLNNKKYKVRSPHVLSNRSH